MPLLQTDAIVLHVADYLESSRLLRLLTREAGVQSVVARGARSSRKRFGSAVDLFAEGQAQVHLKPGRDLHALNGFDVTRARTGLATDLGRFTAAAALAEMVLRVVHEEAAPVVYGLVADGLDRVGRVPSPTVIGETVGVLWQVLAEVGFRPTMDRCGECHDVVAADEPAWFSPVAGGVLCSRCARHTSGRRLPVDARNALRRWLDGPAGDADPLHPVHGPDARAHQRLLREFLAVHLPDGNRLKAWAVWESGDWSPAPPRPDA